MKPADVKVSFALFLSLSFSLSLSELRPPHADVYEYLCKQPEVIKNGFRAAGITEAVKYTHNFTCNIFAVVLYILKNIFEHEIFCSFTNSQTLVK